MIENLAAFEAFKQRYDSEDVCASALYEARWPNGFCCPSCGHVRYYRITTRRLPLFECTACGRQTSVTAGTVMEGSSTSLSRWFQALFLLSEPEGISSMRLSQLLGVTYKTAWLISHKIRHGMHTCESSQRLSGIIKAEHGDYGSFLFPDAKQPLIYAGSFQQKDGREQLTQLKIVQPAPEHVHNKKRFLLQPAFEQFIRNETNGSPVSITARHHKSNPAIRPFKQQVSDWLNNTFNGIGAKHLQAYLNEFCFRLNQSLRGLSALNEALRGCAVGSPLPYKMLTRDRPVLAVPWRAFGNRSKWRASHLRFWHPWDFDYCS